MSTFEFTHTITERIHDIRRICFLELYSQLRETPTFRAMEETVEASPWHREANVLVHTDMVVSEYIRMTDETRLYWSREDFLGAVSCAFHDTGKPSSKIAKYREDRGNYFAFHGHETVSSRLFESWAVDSAPRDIQFTPEEIYAISWMIEHHMPWSIEDKEKRRWLALTAKTIGSEMYVRALMADQYGRLADDQEGKNKKAEEWVANFRELINQVELEDVDTTANMYVLIGTSGSGKSTLTKQICGYSDEHADVFSLDRLRHQWYDSREDHEGYRIAFDMSVADKEFESKADRVFNDLLKQGHHIVLDNVNAGVKRRGKYIRMARQKGYRIIGVTMPVSLDTVLERQHIRPDKNVPDYVVKQQYASIQQPSIGEVDEIVVSAHNMKPFVDGADM